MDETGRHTRLFYMQPTMAKLIAGAAALWSIGVPVVLAIKLGDFRLLLCAPLGLLLIPAALMFASFGRIMLWVQLILFWYIRGVAAAIAMLLFVPVAIAVLFTPAPIIDQIAPVLQHLPMNAISIAAIVLMLIVTGAAGYALMRRRADGGSSSRLPTIPPAGQGSSGRLPTIPPAAGPPAAPLIPPTGPPRALTYLEHRQRKTP